MSTKVVDSYRWLPRGLAAYYQGLDLPRRDPVPWTPPRRPPAEATVAVVTTAGVHLKDDRPFDLDRERREPQWGDPSYRMLPRGVATDDVSIGHLHYDNSDALADLDVVFPVPLLAKLESEGRIGRVASRHYSFMGFQLDPAGLLQRHLPEVVEKLREDAVESVVLTPA